MIFKRAYKFRFYPTTDQVTQLEQTFGCSRYVYNHFLRVRTAAWFERQERMTYVDTAKELTILKRQPETLWLADVSSVALQQSLRHLDTAFRNFFSKRSQYPTFKSKKNRIQSAVYMRKSFTLKTDINDNKILTLTKHEEPLNVKWSRTLPSSDPSNITVSKDSAGRYFVSLLFEEEIHALPRAEQQVPYYVGLKSFEISNVGEPTSNPNLFLKEQKRLAIFQRKRNRKLEVAKASIGLKGKPIPKGTKLPKSNNYQKNELKVSRLHAKLSDARNDFLQKLSTTIVRENQVVAVRDFNVAGMIQNKCFANRTSDISWSRFLTMLEYKCAWYGRTFAAKLNKSNDSNTAGHAGI
jgi:putative transposase